MVFSGTPSSGLIGVGKKEVDLARLLIGLLHTTKRLSLQVMESRASKKNSTIVWMNDAC